jgi:sialic acid synthase SpsE
MIYDRELVIAGRRIGPDHPTYFIADIAANHDGDLERAKALIHQAAEAGADAAKFQHFQAKSIVSDKGFRSLGGQKSHQAQWDKSVFQVYADASVSLDWTAALKEACDRAGITFFTSPYAFDLVDEVDPYVPAYKIGSGDITWPGIIDYIASKGKPFILATGASTADEVAAAVEAACAANPRFALLQCNTNYTASLENFKYIQLNVLRTYTAMFPGMVLGLSDHTPGHATVLGAVALGARIVEKHFTDDVGRVGPDHAFSMDPRTWRDMVDRTRELENALGNGIKRVEANERETVVLQRRSLRAVAAIEGGTVLTAAMLEPLRPCPPDAIAPLHLPRVLGRRLRRPLAAGDHLQWTDLE